MIYTPNSGLQQPEERLTGGAGCGLVENRRVNKHWKGRNLEISMVYVYMYLRLHTYYVYIYICSPVGMIFFLVKTKIERRCLEFSSLECDIFQMTNLAGHF